MSPSSASSSTSSAPDRRGRDAAAQCLPLRFLHAGRHARAARHLRHHLDRGDDGPDQAAWADRGEPAPAAPASACSGTSWTWSGSASSLSSTCSERSGEHHDDHPGAAHLQATARRSHGSRRGYLTGFVLSAILTAIPFWLVMGEVLEFTPRPSWSSSSPSSRSSSTPSSSCTSTRGRRAAGA